MLKRKNEESQSNTAKRVALDSEVVEQKDLEEDKQKTSASVTKTSEGEKEDKNEDVQMKDIDSTKKSGPISSHKVHNDDPTYVHFRMLCTVSETATIVGKGGETINKIKEMSSARINASDNLKGIPERIISVRGPSEHVAKAFGLIARIILEEPLDQSSSLESKQLNLRLLFPHTVMGYIIGKKGAKFREIEENSAAALKANDQILPASTDRILNINGVADAIHIATYYVASTILEHKAQMTKAIYYNPANFTQASTQVPNGPAAASLPLGPGALQNSNNNNNDNSNNHNNNSHNNNRHQFPQQGFMMGMPPQMMQMYGQMAPPSGLPSGPSNSKINNPNSMPIPQHMAPYMIGQQFPQYAGAATASSQEKVDYYVPQNHIGLVIGKGGKNLKDMRAATGVYVKVNDEVPGASERKLTLNGTTFGINNAIMMINNKIENEKARQLREARNSESGGSSTNSSATDTKKSEDPTSASSGGDKMAEES